MKRLNALAPWIALILFGANIVVWGNARDRAYERGLFTGKMVGRCEVQRPLAEALQKPDLIARVNKICAGVEEIANAHHRS